MKTGLLIGSTFAGCCLGALLIAERPDFAVFTGMCDASAAAALDGERVVVADDEDNILRIYHRDGGQPLAQQDVSEFLGNMGRKKGREADLEAAAQVGSRTFWITSHGRNSKGKEAPERQRLFATEIHAGGSALDIVPVGLPYADLLEDFLAESRLARYWLAEAAQLPPKSKGGLNIEGLAETPEGHLLIGFRNPVPEGKALIVPLLNPNDLLEGKRARFGRPLELDLGGLGIRSLGFHGGRWLIIAGAIDNSGPSQLFEWNGTDQPRSLEQVSFAGINPEGLTFNRVGGADRYFVFSDDGGQPVGGVECKKLKDAAQKRFRGAALNL